MIHKQEKDCNSMLGVLTLTDITTFYYASPVTRWSDSLKNLFNHTDLRWNKEQLSPAKMLGGGEGAIYIWTRKPGLCAEPRNSGGCALRHWICSERSCLTMKPCTKGAIAPNVPAPALPPRNRATSRFGNITEHRGRRNPTHSNQIFAIAGERQLSERPCVVEVSFCQTTGIQTKPVMARDSCGAVVLREACRNPKARSKRKASYKALVELVELISAGLPTNGILLGKAFSCTLAGVNC